MIYQYYDISTFYLLYALSASVLPFLFRLLGNHFARKRTRFIPLAFHPPPAPFQLPFQCRCISFNRLVCQLRVTGQGFRSGIQARGSGQGFRSGVQARGSGQGFRPGVQAGYLETMPCHSRHVKGFHFFKDVKQHSKVVGQPAAAILRGVYATLWVSGWPGHTRRKK